MFTPSKYNYTPKTPKRRITTLSSASDTEKDPVKVYSRLIPNNNVDSTTCMEITSPQELCISNESKGIRKNTFYKFKHIFPSHSTQKEVFDHIGYPVIEDLLNGKNGLLFAYGVTGSGKTYTLTGDPNNPGIIPRSINTIFNSIEGFQTNKYLIKTDKLNSFEVQSEDEAKKEQILENKMSMKIPKKGKKADNLAVPFFHNDDTKISNLNTSRQYAVFVSYIEIYNNNVYDLLDDASAGKILQNKILREDVNHNMYVNGVVEIEVKSAQEAFELLVTGQKKKKTAYTNLNSESSRSHSVFNLRIVQLEKLNNSNNDISSIDQKRNIVISNLSLTDLAGSERSNRTQNTGARLKEASSINNSLMTLRTCLEILRENQLNRGSIKLVPYRDSRLTHLFKNYFEGDGSVQMIVCVNPVLANLEENLHVMKFAEITQDIKIIRTEPKSIQKSVRKGSVVKKGPIKATHNFPVFKFDLNNVHDCGAAINNVLKALSDDKFKTKVLDTKISNTSKEFRKRLVDAFEEDLHTSTEIKNYKILLQRQKIKTRNLETKIVQLDAERKKVLQANKEFETVIQTIQNRVDEKQWKINQNILEKKNDNENMALVADKMKQELEKKLKQQRDFLSHSLLIKEAVLNNVRKVLETENVSGNEKMELRNTSPPSYLYTTPQIVITPPNEYVPRRRSRSVDEVLEKKYVESFLESTYPSSRKRKSDLILEDVSNKHRALTKKTEIGIVLFNNSPNKTVDPKQTKVPSHVE
uniref:Kinesin-like protein KIF23 n=1 Tax=Diabrotica virgifera virgifera TaxID=50390 RepID=A0A6P7GL47_DIAVI